MKIIIISLLLIIITGCNYTELNDLSIINNIGINYTNNEYTLYAEIIDKVDKDNLPETKLLQVSDKNIKNCFQKLINLSTKTIHYSHIELLILSPDLDNKNIEEIFNYFLNNQNFRNDFKIISSNNIKELLEKSKYNELKQLLENKNHQEIINIDIENIIKEYLNTKNFSLSLFIYENNNIIYQNNITYPYRERQNNEK